MASIHSRSSRRTRRRASTATTSASPSRTSVLACGTCTMCCGTCNELVRPPMAQALSVQNLRKTYADVVAVDGIDLAVESGECFGLLGPNGAGKTTTIEICEGLTSPDSGDVRVLGRQWATDERDLRQRLAGP